MELRELIGRMSRANPLWGAPRIHGELLKLGLTVSQATVSKYMLRPRRPPSQTWRTFLKNHAAELIALDFFTVPTATFRVLFVLVMLTHSRRRLVHCNVTEHPTAEWTARQLLEACGLEGTPRYLIRDRVIGSIRRECLDHVVVIGEHRLRILAKYTDYYNRTRTHLSLTKDAPEHRTVQRPSQGRVMEIPRMGGPPSRIRAACRVSR
jgi:hypothetical protein